MLAFVPPKKFPPPKMTRGGLFGLTLESLGTGYFATAQPSTIYWILFQIVAFITLALVGQELMVKSSGWGLRICSGFVNYSMAMIVMFSLSTTDLGKLASVAFINLVVAFGYFVITYWRKGIFPSNGIPFFNIRKPQK